jgi:hypothetical protein
MPQAKLKPHKVGIFAIDPGQHTGISTGIFDLTLPLVKEAMRGREHSVSNTITGHEWPQIYELHRLFDDFYNLCHKQLVTQIELVIEDFSLVPGGHTPGKEGVSPIRFGWGFAGYLKGLDPHADYTLTWQLPSAAMRYNTKEHLQNWDAWIRGRPHERAAFAHVGLRLFSLFKLHK